MHDAGRQRPGTMAAILGLATELVTTACREASEDGQVVVPANLNTPDQTVISGDPAAVERAGEKCKAAGAKRVMPLKVSGAFHSPLMAPAQAGLRVELERVNFVDPAFPVIANASAEPVRGAAAARRLLDQQLVAPVRWVESMKRAAEVAGAGVAFVEVGPGNVLGGLLRRIVPEARAVSLGTADEVTRFLEAA
jgi:[acyl-carrier-protein] S-malonyltransferase